MTAEITPTKKNYLLTTLQGGFWSVLQFATTFVVGAAVSILLTRYFGAHTYGLLAYLIWFSTVTQLVLNFGLLVTTQTWVPKYYFTGELPRAAYIARQLLRIQLLIALTGVVVLLPLIFFWHRFVSFSSAEFTRLMFINLLPIVSTMFIVFFSTLLVAVQRFKQSSIIYIVGQGLSLITVLATVQFNLGLATLLLLLSGVNLIMILLYLRAGRDILRQMISEWRGESGLKQILRFSGWAYANTILVAVIWDKSAFFFLGKFHSGEVIAIYGIAYTLALTVVSLLDPIVSVLTTMLAELTAKKDWDRIRLIIRLCAKYVSLLLLPLVTLAYALSPYVVQYVYGAEFLMVASIFPWLLLSATVNRVFAPAWSIPQYMHDLNKMVPRNVAVALLNIALDIILIPRLGIWGAVIATVSTQVSALLFFVFFTRRYSLRLITKEYVQVIALNAVFFALVYMLIKHQSPWYQSLAISMSAVIIYGLFVMKMMVSQADRQLFRQAIFMVKHRSASSPIQPVTS